MATKKGIKVCVACSSGGHLIQAKELAEVFRKYDHFYFTCSGAVADGLAKEARVRTIPNVARTNPLTWIVGFFAALRVAIAERPDVIITTGAGVVIFFCVLSKLMGAKLVFLESMAKVKKPTLTARMLYPFSDLFLVQWPGLVEFFPKAKYLGRLF